MADKFKFIIIAILAMTMMVITATAFDEPAKSVTITRNGEVTEYETEVDTIGEFLSEQNYAVNKQLNIYDRKDEMLQATNELTIYYDVPVTINLDGVEEVKYYKEGTTVGEVINDVETTTESKVVYALDNKDEKINKPHHISLQTVNTTQFTKTEEIPYEKETVKTDELYEGESKVTQEGKNGTVEKYTKVTYYGSEEVSREELEPKVLVQPVNEITLIGTKEKPVPVEEKPEPTPEPQPESSNNGGNLTPNGDSYSKAYTMSASAYCINGYTASGTQTHYGTVAVDPNVIPLGTRLYIPGYGYAVAEDTGGAIKGNKIDVWVPSYDEAIQFGRRDVTVYVLN